MGAAAMGWFVARESGGLGGHDAVVVVWCVFRLSPSPQLEIVDCRKCAAVVRVCNRDKV